MTQSIPQLPEFPPLPETTWHDDHSYDRRMDLFNEAHMKQYAMDYHAAALSAHPLVGVIPEQSGFHDPERLKAWDDAGRQIAKEELSGMARQPLAVQQDRGEAVSASTKDAVFQAAIDFIKELTGMEPPPIEVAPAEVFKPFHDFTNKVCALFAAPSGVDAAAQGAAMERTPREKTYESLLRACVGQLRQWNVKYGNFQPSWLPPAGEVSLIETIEDWIGTPAQGVDHG